MYLCKLNAVVALLAGVLRLVASTTLTTTETTGVATSFTNSTIPSAEISTASQFTSSVNSTGASSLQLPGGTSTAVPGITHWTNQSSTLSSFPTGVSNVTAVNNETFGPSVNTTSLLSPTASSSITQVAFNTTLSNNGSSIASSSWLFPEVGRSTTVPGVTEWNNQSSTDSSFATGEGNMSTSIGLTTLTPITAVNNETSGPFGNTTSLLSPTASSSITQIAFNTTLSNNGSSIASSSSLLPEVGTSTAVPGITAWNNQSSSTHSSFATGEGNMSTSIGLTTFTPITAVNNETPGSSVNTTSPLSPTASSSITQVAFNTTLSNNGSSIASSSWLFPEVGNSTTVPGVTEWNNQSSTHSSFTTGEGNMSTSIGLTTLTPITAVNNETSGPSVNTTPLLSLTASSSITQVAFNTTLSNNGSSIASSSWLFPEVGNSTTVPGVTEWNNQSSTDSSFATGEGNMSTSIGLTTLTPITAVNNETSGPFGNTTSLLSPTASSSITQIAFNTTLSHNGSSIASSSSLLPEVGTSTAVPGITAWNNQSSSTHSSFATGEGNMSTSIGLTTFTPITAVNNETPGSSVNTTSPLSPTASSSITQVAFNTTLSNNGSSIASSSWLFPEVGRSTTVPGVTEWNNQSSTDSSFATGEGNMSTSIGLTTLTPITAVNNETSGPSVNTTPLLSLTASSSITQVAFNTTLSNNGSSIASSSWLLPEVGNSTTVPGVTEWNNQSSTHSSFATGEGNMSTSIGLTTLTPITTVNNETSGPFVNTTSLLSPTASSSITQVAFNTTLSNNGSSIASSSSLLPEVGTSTAVPGITAWNNQSTSTHSSFATGEGNMSTSIGLTTFTPITAVNNETPGSSVNTTPRLSLTASSSITQGDLPLFLV
ncbi:uncharacterized protein PB18E9.04c-like [Microcaecilia unicolor]|uniref:Uncharacterized protein PB18E9.04c-like n=1 Tax=Microcaecilia unicolor TaxID=1415580 RepID=A0A6P7X1K2_9AMPH|nr:uncharacterized protein PB18E9.04c-like [Microcaecilia unicolor]